MGTRAHYFDSWLDSEGEPVANGSVYVCDEHTEDLISATIYGADSDHPTDSADEQDNPLVTGNDGSFYIWLAAEQRVTLRFEKSGEQTTERIVDVSKNPTTGLTVQDESSDLTNRNKIAFLGAGVTAADDAGNGRTTVTIPAGVTDHGALTGLSDDDHPQYARKAAANTFTEDQTIEAGNKIIMGTPYFMSGSNTPEGTATAPVGSLFLRSDGGSGTTLYVKESGSGNTGWRAMSSGARLLGGAGSGAGAYDPATAATASTASLLAMTALDTTNLRAAITAPASGKVRVYMRVGLLADNAATPPGVVLGVLHGSTVKLRVTPVTSSATSGGDRIVGLDARGIISGLTPGSAYNLDFAYGVEVNAASTNLGWGGPNNTTINDAYGAAIFEVWEVVT